MSDDIYDRLDAQDAMYEMGIEQDRTDADRAHEETYCSGCGKTLLPENAWVEDGCPCNSPKGINDGNRLISLWRQQEGNRLRYQVQKLETQLADARLLARAYQLTAFMEVEGSMYVDGVYFKVDLDSDGLPVLTDELRAALKGAVGKL